ncbi:uncharacterized protein LOC144646907 [Oculina patagonica]
MMKILVLLAVLVAITAARFLDESCTIGMQCSEDSECQCFGDENILCDSKYRCKPLTFWEEIKRRKPCFRIFKNPCVSNLDCPCDGKLICEDGECVEKRNPRVVARRT